MEQNEVKKAARFVWPNDGQDWIGTRKAGVILNMVSGSVRRRARRHGLEMWQPSGRYGKTLLLRAEVESWAETQQLYRQWKKRHDLFGGKRQTERLAKGEAAKIFCDVKEAAAMLDASKASVYNLVARGRLYSYQSKPAIGGSKLWFSRRAVEQIRDDPAWQAGRARALKGAEGRRRSAEQGREKREQGVWLDKQGAFANRGRVNSPQPGQGGNWLNANEAAALMGVDAGRIRILRQTGRLEGLKIGRKPGHGRWHYREGDLREWMTQPDYLRRRERWEKVGERTRAASEREAERQNVARAEQRRERGQGGHPGGVW